VTGFVGAEKTRPTALTRREVDNIIRPHIEGAEAPVAKRRMPTHEFEVNDTVQIKSGPFATFSGHVAEINEDQLKVKVLVDIFGRETRWSSTSPRSRNSKELLQGDSHA